MKNKKAANNTRPKTAPEAATAILMVSVEKEYGLCVTSDEMEWEFMNSMRIQRWRGRKQLDE